MSVLNAEGQPARGASPPSIQNVVDLFHEAECELKKIEHINDELPIPPINELRYAGHHLARAWSARDKGDEQACGGEIDKAARHCQRAIYDAHEVGIQFNLKRIQQFQEDYRTVPVVEVVKNYAELRAQAKAANDHIQLIASKHKGERDGYYAECREHYNKVKTVADTLDESRDGLNVQIARDARTTRRWAIGIFVGVLSLMVGVAAVIARLAHPSP